LSATVIAARIAKNKQKTQTNSFAIENFKQKSINETEVRQNQKYKHHKQVKTKCGRNNNKN